MHSQADVDKVASTLLASKGLTLISCRTLQTLWAGYGHVCSLEATSAATPIEKRLSLILKYVSPLVEAGKRQDEGHLRKVISYQVKQHFYAHLAPAMPKDVAVASCLASVDTHDDSGNIMAMILSDLRQTFPVAGEKRGWLNQKQVLSAINWLAGFHGFWWTQSQSLPRDKLRRPPLEEGRNVPKASVNKSGRGSGVWLNGGYTYLATRMSEYNDLQGDSSSEWSDKLCSPRQPSNDTVAERVARFLSPSPDDGGASPITAYETLIHGDVKSENLFVTDKSDAVAFYDFQYVGLGLGVCDLAKLFTCSVPEDMLFEDACEDPMHPREEELLRYYLKILETVSAKTYDWDVFVRHWEVALVDWLRFQASWGFWGNTDWLEARVRTILADRAWQLWLDKSLDDEHTR